MIDQGDANPSREGSALASGGFKSRCWRRIFLSQNLCSSVLCHHLAVEFVHYINVSYKCTNRPQVYRCHIKPRILIESSKIFHLIFEQLLVSPRFKYGQ